MPDILRLGLECFRFKKKIHHAYRRSTLFSKYFNSEIPTPEALSTRNVCTSVSDSETVSSLSVSDFSVNIPQYCHVILPGNNQVHCVVFFVGRLMLTAVFV